LIERSLQSSRVHIEAGQSLGFSNSKVWRTLTGLRDVRQSVTGRGGRNYVTHFIDG